MIQMIKKIILGNVVHSPGAICSQQQYEIKLEFFREVHAERSTFVSGTDIVIQCNFYEPFFFIPFNRFPKF